MRHSVSASSLRAGLYFMKDSPDEGKKEPYFLTYTSVRVDQQTVEYLDTNQGMAYWLRLPEQYV